LHHCVKIRRLKSLKTTLVFWNRTQNDLKICIDSIPHYRESMGQQYSLEMKLHKADAVLLTLTLNVYILLTNLVQIFSISITSPNIRLPNRQSRHLSV